MSLIHGRNISAEEVERIVGREFPIQQFVSLCNALTWATSKPAGVAQVSFTERIFVADSGVDGEWEIELAAVPQEHGVFLGAGRSVLQYKQRDVSGGRNRVLPDLRHTLRHAAREVADRTGRALDSYVLFTNVSLTVDENRALRLVIEEGYPYCSVRVLGAAEIATLLNNFPHLRSAYFDTVQFATWDWFWDRHKQESLSGAVPTFIGRQGSEVKVAVDDESVRVILLSGPPDIGKTRLALNSTEHRPFETIFAVDGRSVSVSDLIATKGIGGAVLVVIDDPDPHGIEGLITAAVSGDVKLILTVPSSSAGATLNYGQDARVKAINVVPLTDAESGELLRAANARMDYSVESWVIDQAGGNPGILIVAAAVGSDLRIEGRTFPQQVARRLDMRARTDLGDQCLDLLRDISVMTAVGVVGHAAGELDALCTAFGRRPNDILRQTRTMTDSGFLRLTGSYVEVVPPVFAVHLAQDALAGRTPELARLFVALAPSGRERLLRRLRQLQADAVGPFWQELFRTGPLSSFAAALGNVELLRLVTPAVPRRVAELLREGLSGASLEERTEIAGMVRRELVWTIEQLLFRSGTAETAVRLLALLAEAENETWSNNSTHTFAECFLPQHPQLPLSLGKRVTIICEILETGASKRRKQIALKAVESAFNRWGSVNLRRSEGPEPFDAVPILTYGEIRQYWLSLLELVRPLLRDGDAEVASGAGGVVIRSIGEYTIQAEPNRGAALLEELGPQILAETVPITLEDYVQSLDLIVQALENQEQFRDALATVRNLLAAIHEGGFMVQLKRWVGSWEYGDEVQDDDGKPVYQGSFEIRRLAKRTVDNPQLLTGDLLSWLVSAEAKRAYEFFFWLGKWDCERVWREAVERLGAEEEGYRAFASYFGGRASEDPQNVAERLDELSDEQRVTGTALVAAIGYLPADRVAVALATNLLQSGRVGSEFAEKALMGGGWMRPLSSGDAAILLMAIAGPRFENPWPVIDFLAMWLHHQKPIEGDLTDLAWRALEAFPKRGEAWDFDIVAAALAAGDHDRGFALLQRYLTLPHDQNTWEPLDRHGGNRFWNALWTIDAVRCLETLTQAANESPLIGWRIRWHLPEILDLKRDHDELLRFAGKSERDAEFISSCLESKEGFWPLAFELISLHPNNQKMWGHIASAAEYINRVITGPSSEHHQRCAQEVDRVLNDPATPPAVRPLLADLARHLYETAEIERRGEQDESINW